MVMRIFFLRISHEQYTLTARETSMQLFSVEVIRMITSLTRVSYDLSTTYRYVYDL
jgi:hypothetical protein